MKFSGIFRNVSTNYINDLNYSTDLPLKKKCYLKHVYHCLLFHLLNNFKLLHNRDPISSIFVFSNSTNLKVFYIIGAIGA